MYFNNFFVTKEPERFVVRPVRIQTVTAWTGTWFDNHWATYSNTSSDMTLLYNVHSIPTELQVYTTFLLSYIPSLLC